MLTQQVIRFGLVGLVSNALIYLIYIIITHVGVEPKKAMTVTYIVGVAIGFFGNRTWTFNHGGKLPSAALRYLIAHFFGYLLNLFILFLFVDLQGYTHQLVQAVAILVVAGYLFLASKYFVFSKKYSVD